MEIVTKLPEKKAVIGAREIQKGIRAGKIGKVIVASNCPDFLAERVSAASIERFDGNQRELGTKLGKPFAVAMVGYE